MAKTIIQVWFVAETENITRPGRFIIFETELTFARFCEGIEDNALIAGNLLFTQRATIDAYQITERTPTAFRGMAVARCQVATGSYIELADAA